MSTVKVKVNASGGLKKLRDNLRANTVDLLIDTLNEAFDTAGAIQQASENGSEGNNDTRMEPVQFDEAGLSGKVIMSGSDALFVECGAGDLTDPPSLAGSYSSTKGSGEYAEKGYWHYDHKVWRGIRPYRPIYEAAKTARRYIEEHASEVFKR